MRLISRADVLRFLEAEARMAAGTQSVISSRSESPETVIIEVSPEIVTQVENVVEEPTEFALTNELVIEAGIAVLQSGGTWAEAMSAEVEADQQRISDDMAAISMTEAIRVIDQALDGTYVDIPDSCRDEVAANEEVIATEATDSGQADDKIFRRPVEPKVRESGAVPKGRSRSHTRSKREKPTEEGGKELNETSQMGSALMLDWPLNVRVATTK